MELRWEKDINSGIVVDISKKRISRPLLSRSRLNLFSKLLLDNVVISGALICQTRVKCERKNKGRGIPIFDLPPEFQEASRPKVIGEE